MVIRLAIWNYYSPEKWLYNWIYHPSNRSKQIQETHTAYGADTQCTRQSLNGRRYTWLHRQLTVVCEAMYVVFHSNFAAYIVILCTGAIRGGTVTNRQCFADICKSRQSRFGSKSWMYCRIDTLKTINTAQRHVDNKHRQLILPICIRFIANLALPTLADIGNALPISLCAVPKPCEFLEFVWTDCWGNKSNYVITSPANYTVMFWHRLHTYIIDTHPMQFIKRLWVAQDNFFDIECKNLVQNWKVKPVGPACSTSMGPACYSITSWSSFPQNVQCTLDLYDEYEKDPCPWNHSGPACTNCIQSCHLWRWFSCFGN